MRKLIVIFIYGMIFLSYSFNSKQIYIGNINVFELMYVIDKKKKNILKKENEFKKKKFSYFSSKKL